MDIIQTILPINVEVLINLDCFSSINNVGQNGITKDVVIGENKIVMGNTKTKNNFVIISQLNPILKILHFEILTKKVVEVLY